jgi:predicted  nucleic acid-binding Zn ribbon protein
VQALCSQLGIAQAVAEALLLKAGWQPQRVIERVTEDPDFLHAELGLRSDSQSQTKELCPCCYEQCDQYTWIEECGHFLCDECFETHLQTWLDQG